MSYLECWWSMNILIGSAFDKNKQVGTGKNVRGLKSILIKPSRSCHKKCWLICGSCSTFLNNHVNNVSRNILINLLFLSYYWFLHGPFRLETIEYNCVRFLIKSSLYERISKKFSLWNFTSAAFAFFTWFWK